MNAAAIIADAIASVYTSPTLIVGISGPQGCGKTTLMPQLCSCLQTVDIRAVALSLDDFYLDRASQLQLPDDPLLVSRGNPGTHDLDLLRSTLDALWQSEGVVKLPQYDKTQHQGQGDRVDNAQWPTITAADVDVVLLEGWMVGFTAVTQTGPELRQINAYLKKYTDIWRRIGFLVQLKADDIQHVYTWRSEAEQQHGPNRMVDITAFIDRFMPAYRQYLPHLHPDLVLLLDSKRTVIDTELRTHEPASQRNSNAVSV